MEEKPLLAVTLIVFQDGGRLVDLIPAKTKAEAEAAGRARRGVAVDRHGREAVFVVGWREQTWTR